MGDALGRGLSLTRHIHPLQDSGGASKGGQAGHPCMLSQKGSCHQPMAVGSSGHKPLAQRPQAVSLEQLCPPCHGPGEGFSRAWLAF